MTVNKYDYQEVEEIIDFLNTVGICYHLHNGNPRWLKKCARALKQRFTRPQSRKYCEAVINDPEGTHYIVNTISQGHFSVLAIRDNSKPFVV